MAGWCSTVQSFLNLGRAGGGVLGGGCPCEHTGGNGLPESPSSCEWTSHSPSEPLWVLCLGCVTLAEG